MRLITGDDYEAAAQQRLDPAAWAYYSGGAGDEQTLRANRAAFARLALLPRMLRGYASADLATTVLGTPVTMPVLVAATALQGLACPEGECATAAAAGSAGVIMSASTESTRSLEEIAATASGPLWFQLYVYHNRSIAERLVRRAEEAGYRAIVLTVDLPRWSGIERSIRVGPPQGPGARYGNLVDSGPVELVDAVPLTWADIAWLRSLTSLPIILKGLLAPDDARLAVEHGVDGIVVSNHGGRSLDGVLPTLDALPGVVGAVAGRCEVYLDGGVRRGIDVLKALALGARAVFVGRPALWGLAVAGEDGVRDVLAILRTELEKALVLCGLPDIASIDETLLVHQQP